MLTLTLLSKTLVMLTFQITILFFTAKSPLTLAFLLFLSTLSLTLLICSLTSSWYAMTLFLFFLGGLLVMFAYFAALSPNKPINLSKLVALILLTLTLFALYTPLNTLTPHPAPNHHTQHEPTTPFLSALFSPENAPLLLLLTLLLLFALLAVVKITYFKKGPLRPFTPTAHK